MYVMETSDESSVKLTCCIIGFIFVFIIMVFAIIWTNCEKFENFTDSIKYNNETIKNVLSGGKHYLALSPSNDINKEFEKLDSKDKVALVGVLAPWCGYCKRLKESGELKTVAKHFDVIVLDDKHPQVRNIMNAMGAEGFPSLAIYYSGQLIPYKGDRKASDILRAMKSLSNELPKVENFTSGKLIKIPNELTLKEFQEKTKKHKKVVTVFMADWCGHCKRLKESKFLDKLAAMGANVFMADDNARLTKEMKVRGFPTIFCLKGGKQVSYDGERDPKMVFSFCD